MTIIPSHLDDGTSTYDHGGMFNNPYLRLGEVQEVIPPDSPKSLSKRITEYTVYVQEWRNGTVAGRMYNYCVVSNLFGGLADMLTYTLRPAPQAAGSKDSSRDAKYSMGSKVALLCVNGHQHSGLIIGGIRDPKDRDVAAGHHLDFVFNGVAASINDAGELLLEVHGKTDVEGKTGSEVGTSVKVSQSGAVNIKTKSTRISMTDGVIEIEADSKVSVKAPDVNVNATKVTVEADIVQLGKDGLAIDPDAGVAIGAGVEPLSGKKLWQLGWTSPFVTARKADAT